MRYLRFTGTTTDTDLDQSATSLEACSAQGLPKRVDGHLNWVIRDPWPGGVARQHGITFTPAWRARQLHAGLAEHRRDGERLRRVATHVGGELGYTLAHVVDVVLVEDTLGSRQIPLAEGACAWDSLPCRPQAAWSELRLACQQRRIAWSTARRALLLDVVTASPRTFR